MQDTRKTAWPISQPLNNALIHGSQKLQKDAKLLKDAQTTIHGLHIASGGRGHGQPPIIVDQKEFGEVCGDILLHLMSTLKFHHDLLEKVLVITKNHCGSEPIILREPFSLLLAAIGGSIASADATVGNIKKAVDAKRGMKHPTISSKDSKDTVGSSRSSSEASHVLDVATTPAKKRKLENGSSPIPQPVKSEEVHIKAEKATSPEVEPTKKSNNKKRKSKARSDSDLDVEPFTDKTTIADSNIKPSNAKTIFQEPAPEAIPERTNTNQMPPPPAATEEQRKNSFEDISDEVEARLKAKEAKRKEKDERKKRKRESIASSIFSAEHSEDEAEVAPFKTAIKEKRDDPPKKKFKTDISPEEESAKTATSQENLDVTLGKSNFIPYANSAVNGDGHTNNDTTEPSTNKATNGKTEAQHPGAAPEKDKKIKRSRSSDSFRGPAGPSDSAEAAALPAREKKAKRVKTG